MKKSVFFLFAAVSMILSAQSCEKSNNPEEQPKDKVYIVISDIHLGDVRSEENGYGWNLTMKDTLAKFLDYLYENKDWDELIVAGDLFEEWTIPQDQNTLADKDGNILTEAEFFDALVDHHKAVFDKFRKLRDAGHKLVYIPGNHDMLATAADFERKLPGLFDQARMTGADGMGEYCPDSEIYVEHGHRYDILNAPYLGKDGGILPPGFFECRLFTGFKEPEQATKAGPIIEDNFYDIFWNGVGIVLGRDSVVTNIDGWTGKYGFGQYACSDAELYTNIDKSYEPDEGWNARCERLGAYFVPSVTTSILSGLNYDYCDEMGMTVLGTADFKPHILIWGHSHSAKLIADTSESKGKVIYLNVGSWVDASSAGQDNVGTFGRVEKTNDGKYSASLCRFAVDEAGRSVVYVSGVEGLE